MTSRVQGLNGWSAALATVPGTSRARPAAAGKRVAVCPAAVTVWFAEIFGARSCRRVEAAASGDSPPMSIPATTVDLGMLPCAVSRSTP
ncbi:MAG TPA: hypothetical protein VGN28_03335 [Blastococcus sp.]|nr:hypothetical protein [Blastococcus sp.]